MYKYLILIFCCIPVFAQNADWIPMCDTLTNEVVYVDQVQGFADCCYRWENENWTKQEDCENVWYCQLKEISTETLCLHSFFYQYDNTTPSDGACGEPTLNYGLGDYITEWVSFENCCDTYDPFSGEISDGGGTLNGYFDAMETQLDANTNSNWDWGLNVPDRCWRYFTTISTEQCYGKWVILDNGVEIEVIPRVRYNKASLTKKTCEYKDANGDIVFEDFYYDNSGDLITDFADWLIGKTGWDASAINNVYPDNQSIINELSTDCETKEINKVESDCTLGPPIEVCGSVDGSGDALTLFYQICDGVYSQQVYETSSLSQTPELWVEWTGEFAYCDGTPFDEPTECDKNDFEAICYYIPKISKGSENGWIDECGLTYDCEQNEITNIIKLDCDCDYSYTEIELCVLDEDSNCIYNFIRTKETLSNCTDVLSNGQQTQIIDYETDLTTIAAVPDGETVPCESCTELLSYECYVCEKEVSIKETKGKTLSLSKRKKKFETTTKSCEYGNTVQLTLDSGGNVVQINGIDATTFNNAGYTKLDDCEVEICEPEMAVEICGDITIDFEELCDTVQCVQVTDTFTTEYLPTGIELNSWEQAYNGGTIDEDNPLLNGETYAPTTSQNLHALFDLNLPDCAVIDSAYILYDHEGSSGTVYSVLNSSTGALIPNSFNGGVNTLNWAWHQGNTASCTAAFGYERIEGIGFPCGTTRPLRYTSRMDFTPTVNDLNNLVVTSVYANGNNDIFHSIKLNVFFTLPNGCQVLDENGEPIADTGEVKVLNTQIVGQKQPLEVTGQLEIIEPCNNEPFTETFCLGEAVSSVGLVAGDFVLQIGQVDCNGNVVGGSYYTIDGTTEITENVVIDTGCAAPSIQELQNCVQDSEGNEYTQIVITDGTTVYGEFYINTMTLQTVDDIGEYAPCDIPTTNFTKNKICAVIDDSEVSGYEISYNRDGEIESYFEYLNGQTTTDYVEFCCKDCIQEFGCFDPRVTSVVSATMANGDVVLVQDLVVDGSPNSAQDMAQTITSIYGGTGGVPSGTGGSILCYPATNRHSFQFSNLSVQVESIELVSGLTLETGTYGECQSKQVISSVPTCVNGQPYIIWTFSDLTTTDVPYTGIADNWCVCECNQSSSTLSSVDGANDSVSSTLSGFKIEMTAATFALIQACSGTAEIETEIGTFIINQGDILNYVGSTLVVDRIGTDVCGLTHTEIDSNFEQIRINCYE